MTVLSQLHARSRNLFDRRSLPRHGWFRRRGSKRMPARCAPPCCNGPAFRCRSASRRPRRWPRSPITSRRRMRNTGGLCCCWMKPAQDAALATHGADGSVGHRRPAGGEAQPARHHDAARSQARRSSLFLRDRLGVVTLRMAMELRGVACLDLERRHPTAKASWPRAPSTAKTPRPWSAMIRKNGSVGTGSLAADMPPSTTNLPGRLLEWRATLLEKHAERFAESLYAAPPTTLDLVPA